MIVCLVPGQENGLHQQGEALRVQQLLLDVHLQPEQQDHYLR